MKLFLRVVDGFPVQTNGKWGCSPVEMVAYALAGQGITGRTEVWEAPDFDLSHLGVYPFLLTAKPVIDMELQTVAEGVPVLSFGNWMQMWDVTNLSNEAVASIQVGKLESVRTERLNNIDADYDTAVNANIAYTGAVFQADRESRELMSQVLTACGGVLPDGFVWYDASNSPVPMTFAQLQGLAGSILLRGQPLFGKAQALKASVRSAQSISEIQAVVW